MELLKKFGKEVSVFGIVLVVFLCLFAYKKITHGEYKTISTTKLEEKVEAGDSFIVLLGKADDSTTTAIQTQMEEYKTAHRGAKLYYVDLTDEEDTTKYIQETLNTDDGTCPQLTAIKDGKVKTNKTGTLTEFEFETFCKNNS